MRPKIFYQFHFIIAAILTMMLISTGCTQGNGQPSPPTVKIPENVRQLAAAERSFIEGNLQEALAAYERLFYNSVSVKDKNSALYGLACARLMLAEDDDQRIKAISDLHQWDVNKGSAPFDENRHLLFMALQRQSTVIEQQNKIKAKLELQKDHLIDDQKKKIAQMASKLEELQKQLEELEAVEENFQEKRKPL